MNRTLVIFVAMVALILGAATIAFAQTQPLKPVSRPSAADVNRAQSAEIKALKLAIANLKENQRILHVNQVALANGLLDSTACLVYVKQDEDSTALVLTDDSDEDAFALVADPSACS